MIARHLIWYGHGLPLNTDDLLVIHNRPCKHVSKLQLSIIRFTPTRCLDVRQDWYPMYFPKGMKAQESPVQSMEKHRIFALLGLQPGTFSLRFSFSLHCRLELTFWCIMSCLTLSRRKPSQNCWKRLIGPLISCLLDSDCSRIGHKPNCQLRWLSEYIKKLIHACHGVSVACRPVKNAPATQQNQVHSWG